MEEREYRMRRTGDDGTMRTMYFLVLGGWFVLLIAFVLYFLAAAPAGGDFYRDSGARIGVLEGGSTMFYALVLLVLLMAFSIWGFFINLRRNRRKSDRFHVSFIIQGILAAVGIFYYLFTR